MFVVPKTNFEIMSMVPWEKYHRTLLFQTIKRGMLKICLFDMLLLMNGNGRDSQSEDIFKFP